MRAFIGFIIVATLAVCANAGAEDTRLTDAQITQRIIDQSIAGYDRNCPCPYNLARNGSRCGKRSAYSRAGGYETICYERDVTPQMIEAYRRRGGS